LMKNEIITLINTILDKMRHKNPDLENTRDTIKKCHYSMEKIKDCFENITKNDFEINEMMDKISANLQQNVQKIEVLK